MRALITGIAGQDGSYLAELLLAKGYEVFGLVRGGSRENYERIETIASRIRFVEADMTDQASLDAAIQQVRPDELYNLAAHSFLPVSWKQPLLTADVTSMGVLRLLEALRNHSPRTKMLQASTSEMFGKIKQKPQNESTPFDPRNPYGVAKVFGHYMTQNYRQNYRMFACSCICFNHESPRRSPEFVTRKVTQTVARIKLGLEKKLKMGNLDSRRDWGFAGDYVRAMWLMLQQNDADDYVISTGEMHSVQELLEIAFSHVGLDWRKHVEIDPQFVRPAEVDYLCGDSSKARRVLGWKPEVNFQRLIEMMVEADLAAIKSNLAARTTTAGV